MGRPASPAAVQPPTHSWRAPLASAALSLTLRLGWGGALLGIGALWAPVLSAQGFAGERAVRVLLLEGSAIPVRALDRPLQLHSRSEDSAPPLAVIPAGTLATLRLQQGQLRLETGDGSAALPTVVALWLDPAPLDSASGGADFGLQQRQYRGRLQIRLQGEGLQAINHLPLESYLPSVVGSEMPASWPQAALRAQAVAARTYALRQRRPEAPFDLKATVTSQVYKGLESETPATREAVRATSGQVLTYDGELANTVFHSSSGGSTENSGDLWSRQLPYLVSVPDFDEGSPLQHWQVRLEPEQLEKAFPEIGGVEQIRVLGTTATGRLRLVQLDGPRGSLQLPGPELRSRLGLRSSLVRFEWLSPEIASRPPEMGSLPLPPAPPALPVLERPSPLQFPRPALLVIGRGYGHGVGMSQWGAYGLAQRGRSYAEILQHYYRGTVLSLDGAP